MNKYITKLIIAFSLFTISSNASHLMGGEITWKCIKSGINSGKYVFEVKVYRDCQGIFIQTHSSIVCHNIPNLDSIPLVWVSGKDISPSCDTINGNNQKFSCFGLNSAYSGNGNGSVEEHIYRSDTISILGSPDLSGWHFTWSSCCRNINISNLQNVASNTIGFTLRAVMYPYIDSTGNIFPNNNCYDSSPIFYEKPRTILEVGNGYDPLSPSNGFTYSHNAYDEEKDSLSYLWAEPLNNLGYDYQNPSSTALSFNSGFSYQNPINGIVMNNLTGRSFYPANQQGNYVTCTNVSAFKCGQKVAEIFREVQVVLVPPICNLGDTTNGKIGADTLCNTRPIVQPPFFYPSSTNPFQWDTTVHCGDTVSFDFIANDYDYYPNGSRQDLLFEVSGGQFFDYNNNIPCSNPPCATFEEIGTNTPPPFITSGGNGGGHFQWITSCNHTSNNCIGGSLASVYTFVIKVQDDFCPAPAIENTSQVISVTVYPPCNNIKINEVINAETSCGSNDGSILVNPSSGFPPYTSYFFDYNGSPVQPNGLSSGEYIIKITDVSLCEITDTIKIPGPATTIDTNIITICSGDSIQIGNNIYTSSGFYSDTLLSNLGCDSIINTFLNVGNLNTFINNQVVCFDSSYSINGNIYNISGTYFDTLLSSSLCDSIVITNLIIQNQIFISKNISNPSCFGLNDGNIDISVNNGIYPFNFLWSNGDTTEDIYSLISGTYILQINDSNNCRINDTTYLVQPSLLQATLNSSSSTLSGSANGGNLPYNYDFFGPNGLILSVNNNNGTPTSINTISSGIYYFIVTDANGCKDSLGINIIVNDFSPNFNISIGNNYCDSITPLTIMVSQDSGEVDMSTGLLTSNAGYFDITSYNVGDTIGTANLFAGGGSITLNTYIMISSIISNNQAIVQSCDTLQGCIGSFTITNSTNGGIEILTQTVPDGNNYTSGNMSSITFDSIFINPCIPLTFNYTVNSELGDIFYDSITFITTSVNASQTLSYKVYPNPNNGNFSLSFDKIQDNFEVFITDLIGRETLYKSKYNRSNIASINTSLKKGIYLLNVISSKVIQSEIIIIH